MSTFEKRDTEGMRKLYEVWGNDEVYGLGVRQNLEDLEKVLRDDAYADPESDDAGQTLNL